MIFIKSNRFCFMESVTYGMIKPEAVAEGNIGLIIADIERSGFKIKELRMVYMNATTAQKFYESLSDKPFFGELCDYITSGPVIAMLLEKDNAVADFRELIGATDPLKATYGTIRKKFGKAISENAIHGSDSDENAKREINIIFGK